MTFFIFSPASGQAVAIARLLRRYLADEKVVGVLLPGERRFHDRAYHDVVAWDSVALKSAGQRLVPTGSLSTGRLLEQFGDLRIGQIQLTRSALRVFDKVWMIGHAEQVGVPVPATWTTSTQPLSYPLFYKSKHEGRSRVRGVARDRHDLPTNSISDLIFQELIESSGTYGVCFLADNGKILVSHTHFERESLPKEGGSAVIIEEFSDFRLEGYARKLVDSLNYSGWGLAEFKYCHRRQDYVFMEINAKFWASCEFAFINEPRFLQLLFGIEPKEGRAQRMIFVDRALARGIRFLIANRRILFNGAAWRAYPGWPGRIAAGVVPNRLKRALRAIILRRS